MIAKDTIRPPAMCVRSDRSRKTTSSSKTDSDRHQRSSSRPRSSSRARSVQRRPSTADSGEDKHRRSRSASTRGRARASTRTPPKQEYDTPFDVKGRCHYHPDVQLARKKLTGGWKVIVSVCPKCSGDKCITNNSSDISSTRSHGERSKSPRGGSDDCKSTSRSVCDNRSVGSRHSSTTKSTRSSRSVSPGRRKILPLSSIHRNEENYPFDDKGYCHRHANVRLAKKKFTGGWKILLDRCDECVADKKDSKSVCSRSSRRSRSKSVCSRSSRRSRSNSVSSRSSRHSRSRSVCSKSSRDNGRHPSRRLSDAAKEVKDRSKSTSKSSNHKKKNVKKMSYTDDTGKEGFYTGYVNDQCKPHGRGKIVYKDKSMYSGTWMEGIKVHGTDAAKCDKNRRNKKDEPKKEESKAQVGEFEDSDDFERQWENERRKAKHSVKVEQGKDHGSIAEYVYLHNTPTKVVNDLPFVDLKGDAGKYTGEVNDKLLPHGQGCLTYDHGLVQDGNWTNGFIDVDF